MSALVAMGQVEQRTYHLDLAIDNGLTTAQAFEVMTQLAFYTEAECLHGAVCCEGRIGKATRIVGSAGELA